MYGFNSLFGEKEGGIDLFDQKCAFFFLYCLNLNCGFVHVHNTLLYICIQYNKVNCFLSKILENAHLLVHDLPASLERTTTHCKRHLHGCCTFADAMRHLLTQGKDVKVDTDNMT